MATRTRKKRKSPRGVTTSDLIVTAHCAGNADVFQKIMTLYVPEGATVADVTYGKGIFWKNIPDGTYNLLA